MSSALKTFSKVFPWQGQPPRLGIQNLTAVILLANLAVLSGLIYLWAFVRPYNLWEWFGQPQLTLRSFAKSDPMAPSQLIWAFLVQGGLYWLGWRLALQARGRIAWLIVLSGALVFSVTMLFLQPFDADDIFDNIMHGRILGVYGANPFMDVARQFPDDPFFSYVAWRRTPSAYGPIWEVLAGGVAWLAGNGVIANVLAFKLLNGLFLAASIGLVAHILRQVAPERALAGVLLLAWNPVVLYEAIGNGHNDIVMAVWLLVAVWAILAHRYTLAILALLVGMLVKFIPLLLLPAAGLMALHDLPHARARWRFLAVTACAAVVLVIASYGPFWYGLESLGIWRRAQLFTTSLPAAVFAWLQLNFGLEDVARQLSMVTAALTALFVLWQSWQTRHDRSWLGFTQSTFNILMFYLLITCTWFQQWYVVWPLVLAALLPPGHASRLAVLFSLTVLSKQLIFEPLLLWTRPLPPWPQRELMLGPAVMLLPWLYTLGALWLVRRGKLNEKNGKLYDK